MTDEKPQLDGAPFLREPTPYEPQPVRIGASWSPLDRRLVPLVLGPDGRPFRILVGSPVGLTLTGAASLATFALGVQALLDGFWPVELAVTAAILAAVLRLRRILQRLTFLDPLIFQRSHDEQMRRALWP